MAEFKGGMIGEVSCLLRQQSMPVTGAMTPQPPLTPPTVPPMRVPAPMQASSSEYLLHPEQRPRILKAQADRTNGLP
eukprot:3988505-Pyramimonas_sp.AAC.1